MDNGRGLPMLIELETPAIFLKNKFNEGYVKAGFLKEEKQFSPLNL